MRISHEYDSYKEALHLVTDDLYHSWWLSVCLLATSYHQKFHVKLQLNYLGSYFLISSVYFYFHSL